MRLVSFDPFRTMQLQNVVYVKPDALWPQRDLLTQANCLLFPEYWQLHALVYGLGACVFPSVASDHLGHDKIEMTRAFGIVIGDDVVGGYWRERAPGAFHNNVSRGGWVVLDPTPDPTLEAALELVRSVARRLQIDRAGFDLMEHDGQLYLLELHRLFGHAGLRAQGIDVALLIARYLDRTFGLDLTSGRPPHRKAS
jgi:hypothetical protein